MLGRVTRSTWRVSGLIIMLALLAMIIIGLGLGLGCEVANEDHCAHKAIESDAWCADAVPGKPFCSPCAAAEHGCVAEQPNAATCPRYSPDSAASSTASDTELTAASTSTG